MTSNYFMRTALCCGLVVVVASCGNKESADAQRAALEAVKPYSNSDSTIGNDNGGDQIWDLFKNTDDPNVQIGVNKYIWTASMDVLSFLPIETVDPFSGVFTTGYGTPPGGGRSYRATVYVQDPALDARSLNVSLQTSGGAAVSDETTRAVEDAILTRARQLRIADSNR
ncbi:DUF3576 domain-containing protein [Falsirhodobacter sp. alg1]|uniref:DUF3576 domain-containing protein n=1 Tax=Falsirhodobacter sp. alg1 TaxID=1472418 RepID=UPI0005EDE6FF|nr:DUF3576 domain-containing protein [Falsirhodobacter sp. alg1]